jgi:hypothetical protein
MNKKMTQILLLATVAPVLAACGAGGNGAPYANLYKASYATEGKNIGNTLDAPGKAIESIGVGTKSTFGDGTTTLVNNDPKKLILERLFPDNNGAKAALAQPEALFKLTYGNASVTFTEADLRGEEMDQYLEKLYLNEDDEERTIAYLYSLEGDIFDIEDKIVVPLGFGFRLKEDGTSATNDEEGVGFANGYTLIGLETNPDTMPKDRTATYEGGAEFRLDNKVETYDSAGIDRVFLYGDSTISANFSTGKVTGELDFHESRIRDNSDEDEIDEKNELNNVKVALNGDIVSNGFTLDLEANEGAQEALADLGITDLEAEGAGRFYGTEAEAIGALVTGESTNYLLNGVIWGNEND